MNKEQLEKLSDELLSLEILKNKCGWLLEKYSTSTDGSAFGLLKGGNGSTTISFNINDWSDMGKLISSNNISIDYYNGDKPEAYAWMTYGYIGASSSSELRAAAIVYLLMQER